MPLPTLDDLKDKGIKKPRVQDSKLETTRARTTKKREEDQLEERDFEVNIAAEQTEKAELLDILFNENENIDFEKILRKEVMNTATKKETTRTSQPLKRVREGMEDVFTTLQLRELIDDFRTTRTKKKDEDEEPATDNNMAYMYPFLQKIQNGGGNAGNIDPNMLMLLMANQGNKGGGNLNNLMMMMLMMNAGTQNQQIDSTGRVMTNNLSGENLKILMTELQNIMKQQEQKPTIDPTVMLMLQMMNKNAGNQPQQNSMRDIATLITALKTTEDNSNSPSNMLLEMMKQNWELQNQRVMSMMPSEAPEDRVLRTFDMFNRFQGDQRQKSVNEMEFDLKRQELLLGEQQRQDMLDREERSEIRSDQKSDRTLGLVSTVMDKVVGNGLGQLVGDLVSARGKGDKGARGKNEPDDFDVSLLDDL